MGRNDSAETKLLDFTSLMNHDFGTRTSGPRKTLHSKAISAVSKVAGTFRGNERPRRMDTARTDLPTLNLAKVRRNLAEQAELATGVYEDIGLMIDQKDEKPLDLTGAHALVSARFGTAQENSKSERAKVTASSERAPKNGFHGEEMVPTFKGKGDFLTESSSRLSYGTRERTVPKHTGNSHQIVLATHLPSSSRQNTHRRAHKAPADVPSLSLNKNGSLTCRGMTAPSNSEAGQEMRLAVERANETLELGSAQVTKTETSLETQKPQTSEGATKPDQSSWESRKSAISHQIGSNSKDSQVGAKFLQGRGMSAGNHSARGLPSTERLQLEEKIRLKLKTARQLQADMNAESEACHRQSFPHLFVLLVFAQVVPDFRLCLLFYFACSIHNQG